MATSSFIVLLFLSLGQLYFTSSELVEFNKAGSFTAVSGESLVLNCTATSLYIIEMMEIGERRTIDEKILYRIPQLGEPSTSHVPEQCQYSNIEIPCSKIVHISVNASMDGKSYQCRIVKRDGANNDYIYSQGGNLHGMSIAYIYSAANITCLFHYPVIDVNTTTSSGETNILCLF